MWHLSYNMCRAVKCPIKSNPDNFSEKIIPFAYALLQLFLKYGRKRLPFIYLTGAAMTTYLRNRYNDYTYGIQSTLI